MRAIFRSCELQRSSDNEVEKKIGLSALFTSILCAGAVHAADAETAVPFTYSARDYVQDGLIGLYDAVENAGWGTHDVHAATWKNLVGTTVMGDLDVTNLKAHTWGDTALTLTSGGVKDETGLLLTPGSVSLTSFTFEMIVKTPANGEFRRWDASPWSFDFESWCNGNEGYLERLGGGQSVTRFAAYKKLLKNGEMQFSSTYDSSFHRQRVVVDGVVYAAQDAKANFSYNGRLGFYAGATDAHAHAIRVYNRALNVEEQQINNVLDQLRFLGKTVETVVLPEGWTFDAAGILRTASGRVMLRPEGNGTTRGITDATFATVDNEVVCTATLEAGADGVTNALYLAWGTANAGADIRDWPCFRRIRNVPPDVTTVSFPVPTDCISYATNVVVRLFLSESVRPYDHLLSSLGVDGRQWLITDYYANPKTVGECDIELSDLTVQQRPFGADSDFEDNAFSCAVYINGSGYWAFAAKDGKGNWQGSDCRAKKERTRLKLDVPNVRLTVSSPSYPSVTKTAWNTPRTKTSTVPMGVLVDNCATTTKLHVRGGRFYRCTFSEEGDVLRDYMPCRVGDRVAIYDAAQDKIHYSSTGVDFLESGVNADASVTRGENPTSSFYAGTIPQSLFIVNTRTAARTIDTPLVYSDGGRKLGAYPLTLTHPENDFGGVFTVEEGALAATFGAGLATTDRLVLDGGIWAPSTETATATIGTDAGHVQLVGERAGFGAFGQDVTLTVSRADGNALVYPSDDFSASRLVLNDMFCKQTLTVDGPLTGAATDTPLTVEVGAGTAVLAKPVSDFVLQKTGAGRLVLAADTNNLERLTVAEGATVFRSSNVASKTGEVATVSAEGLCELVVDNTSLTGTLFRVGNAAEGRLVLTNGAAVTADELQICRGSSYMYDGTLELNKFQGCQGAFYQYGGTVNMTSSESCHINFGIWGGCTFEYYLLGGTFERMPGNGNFQLGRANTNGVANMYVEGTGRLITHCEFPSIGRLRCNMGRLYVRNGGHYTADWVGGDAKICVSDEGSGYLEIASGGEVDVAGYVQMCNGYTHTEREGEVRLLAGGTLKTRGIDRNDSPHRRSTLVFDGGRVVVNDPPKTPFVKNLAEAFVGTAGGVVDTAGHDIRFDQSFAAWTNQVWTQPATAADVASCAAFTKTGEGTLTFNAPNTYAAATCVSNGTLATAVAGALPSGGLLKLAGGTVDLKGTEQTVEMLAGDGRVSNGTLTITDAVWPGLGADGGTLMLDGVDVSFTKMNYALTTDADGRATCGRLTTTGTLDLSGVEISVDGLDCMGDRQVVLIEAAAITGRPTHALPAPFQLVQSGTKLSLSPMTGTLLIFR